MKVRFTTALITAALCFAGCSIENDMPEVKTKDVSFRVCVKCDELTFNDYYGSSLVQSVHKSNVDTAYVELKDMAYGKHELELVIDGKKGRHDFMVSDSTSCVYLLSTVNANIGLTFDDAMDEEVIYEF